MQVFLDGQQIDVTLEDERTVGQVVAAINSWVVDNGMAIVALRVNDRELPLERIADHDARSVEEIAEIHVETRPQWELILSHLELVCDFVQQWYRLLTGPDPHSDPDSQVRELLTEHDDLARHLQEHVELIFPGLGEHPLATTYAATGDPRQMLTPTGGVDGLIRELGALLTLLRQRIDEIREPQREAAVTAGLIHGMLDDVRDVSILLQTGKDEQAMSHVIRFTELVEKLLRIVPHLARTDDTFRERVVERAAGGALTEELNQPLRELLEAFHTQDSVSIGDLLEYEVVPRIDELLSQIPAETAE